MMELHKFGSIDSEMSYSNLRSNDQITFFINLFMFDIVMQISFYNAKFTTIKTERYISNTELSILLSYMS